jgi:hypothetical protein
LNEKQLLISISRLISTPGSLAEAIRQIHALLERDLGGQMLFIVQPDAEVLGDPAIDSQAKHVVHSVSLRASGKALGTLTVIFATASAHDSSALTRIVTFIGEQLGMRMERNRLLNTRTRLIKKVAKMKQHLAVRKAVQRAEGILVARWGLDLSAASLWILRQAECTGRSILEVAMKVCDERIVHKSKAVAPWGLPPGYVMASCHGVRPEQGRLPARGSGDLARSVTLAAGH